MPTLEEFAALLYDEIQLNGKVSIRFISAKDAEDGEYHLLAFRFNSNIGGFLGEYSSSRNLTAFYKILTELDEISEV